MRSQTELVKIIIAKPIPSPEDLAESNYFMNLVNHKNKKNIQFVSFGNNQIEFFEIEEKPYFIVYDPNPESISQISIQLSKCKIIHRSEDGYIIDDGKFKYAFTIKSDAKYIKCSITRKLWGWLPFTGLSGTLTEQGWATIKSHFNAFT